MMTEDAHVRIASAVPLPSGVHIFLSSLSTDPNPQPFGYTSHQRSLDCLSNFVFVRSIELGQECLLLPAPVRLPYLRLSAVEDVSVFTNMS